MLRVRQTLEAHQRHAAARGGIVEVAIYEVFVTSIVEEQRELEETFNRIA